MRFFHQAALAHSSCSFLCFWRTGFGEMAASNSFKHSDEKLGEMQQMHDNEAFMDPKQIELYVVDVADDDGSNREVHGFGDVCPLELTQGVQECKAFKKHHKCQSRVMAKCARNYLAMHAFNSANHACTNGNRKASFEAANSVSVFIDHETRQERDEMRAHVAVQNAQSSEGQAIKQETRRSSSDRSGAIGAGPAARSRSRRRASSHRGPSPSAPSPPRSRIVVGAAQEIERSRRGAATVRINVGELKSLSSALGRCQDSQKRCIESLQFFTRQMEDERKVLQEAQHVIDTMVFAAESRSSQR